MSRHSRISFYTIALAILLVYVQSVSFDFAYDDAVRIKHEHLVNQAWAGIFSEIGGIFSSATFPGDLYRPLTTLSYRVDYLVWGGTPGGFHLTNIFLHIAVAFLFSCFLESALGFSRLTASVASLIFALHPQQVESVASLAGRAELLSALFAFLALRAVRRPWWCAANILLAALSKESGIVAAPLCLLFLALVKKEKRLSTYLLPASAACLAIAARYVVLGDAFFIMRPAVFVAENPLLMPGVGLGARLLPALEIFARYLQGFIFPFAQSSDYSLGEKQFWTQVWSIWGMWYLCGTAVFILLIQKVQDRIYKFGLLWILVTFSLTINLITPIGTLMAERLAYFPLAGFALVVAYASRHLQYRIPVLAGILVLLALLSVARVPVWKNDRVLMMQMVIDAPFSPKAHTASGREFLHVYGDLENAEAHFKRALELDPVRIEAMRELIDLNLRRNQPWKSEFWAKQILHLTPDDIAAAEFLRKLEEFKKS